MQKILSIFAALAVASALSAAETILYSESFTCADDWSSGYAQIASTDLSAAVAGDEINVYVTAVSSGTEWPQVYLQYVDAEWNWVDFADTHNYSLSGKTAPHKATIALTQAMIDNITAGNYLIVKGAGYTAEKITFTHTPAEAGTTQSIWSGSVVMPDNWGAWQTINASKFANAVEGQLLRCRFTDLSTNAQLQLKQTGDWSELVDAPLAQISGRYYDYTITASMLVELKANGVIVSGSNYTLKEVLLINPADLKPLTLAVPVTDNGVFTAKPAITIHIENPYGEPVTANVEVEITTDRSVTVASLSATKELAVGASQDIFMTTNDNLAPGFYKATCIVNDDLARAFVFGIDPTDIVSAPDKQPDFYSFWAAAKAQLADIDMNATLTEITAKSTATRKVYLVEMNSVPDGLTGEPVVVRGYYCEPTDGKKHPVIMHYAGYDSGYRPGGQDVKPYCPSGDAEPTYAEFSLSTRGQNINNRAADEREADGKGDFVNTYGDCLLSISATRTVTTTAVRSWIACRPSASWLHAAPAILPTFLPKDRVRAELSPMQQRHSPITRSALLLRLLRSLAIIPTTLR